MRFAQRRALIIALAILVVLSVAIWLYPEPGYKGRTFSQWVECAAPFYEPDPPFETTRSEVEAMQAESHEALLLLGTNHLKTLVQWISYDPPQNTIFLRILSQHPELDLLASERIRWNNLANGAEVALCELGAQAAPVIPQLHQLVTKGGYPSSLRALNALSSIGKPALPSLLSIANLTSNPMRVEAIGRLLPYTNSSAVRTTITNALHDPAPNVRIQAARVLSGRLF